MKKIVLAGCLISVVAFAGDQEEHKDTGMMAGWTPRKVTKEDRKGIDAVLKADHKAMMDGNMETGMAVRDFPMFMMTDDKDGNVMVQMADAETYKKMMEPSMKAMMEDKEGMAKMAKMPMPKMDMFFLTDTMAVVTSKHMMPMGKGKVEVRSAMLMIRKDGKWMLKGEMMGGWGDEAKKMMEGEKAGGAGH